MLLEKLESCSGVSSVHTSEGRDVNSDDANFIR